jgi:hypothetical protein
MQFKKKIMYKNCIGSHTLLYGEINTKKTYYTAKFVQFLIEEKYINPKEITILDFAPPKKLIKNIKIGGKIMDFFKNSIICNNLSFKGDIIPPRLNAKNKQQLYENACKNYTKTYGILKKFYDNPTKVLIINDISIYLHIGNKKLLIDSIRKSNTFFGNSYYGSSLKSDFSTQISLREKRIIDYLIKKMDYSYFMG